MKNKIVSILITLLSFIAILVCIICNLAILGKFTWSIITTISITFAWLVFIPIIKSGKKGIINGKNPKMQKRKTYFKEKIYEKL